MSRKGNQSGYDLESDAEELYNPGFADSGNSSEREPTVSIGTGQDVSKASKVTLGNYLNNVTLGKVGNSKANSFTVPGDSSDTNGAAYTVNSNLSSHISPADASRQMKSAGTTLGSFIDLARGTSTQGDIAVSKFNSLKDSQYANDVNPFVGTDIKNVGSDERRKSLDGNSLLVGIESAGSTNGVVDLGAPTETAEPSNFVQRKISEVLRQNRFNPIERKFVSNHTRQVPGGFTVQRKMGVYDPNAPEVSETKLKQVGQELMVRSTGHGVPGADLLDSTNDLAQFSNLAPLIPSITQFSGLPLIDVINLQARNVPITSGTVEPPARSEYINQENPEFNAFAGKSYGVLNSHFEPFDGPFPIGTFTTTLAGILSMFAFSALIAGIVEGLTLATSGNGNGKDDTSSKVSSSTDPSELRMGRHALESNDMTDEFILDLLGIPSTDNRWSECLLAGISQFLGMNWEDLRNNNFISILESAFDIAMAPGYYAVVIRNAIRDTEQIVRSTEQFAQGISQATVNGSNIVLSISNFFKMIESITTSATFRFLMTMVRLGNQVLNERNAAADNLNVDNILYRPSTRVMKSRIIQNGTPSGERPPDMGSKKLSALAWKHSASPARYILPKSFVNAYATMNPGSSMLDRIRKTSYVVGSDSPYPQLPDGSDATISGASSNLNRIPAEYVKQMEDQLESEYMPFYFHDLRTNEIISFHAFLSDLSDGFTAGYTNTAGYGRIEEVMVYKDTKRSISFTFVVAATSDEDMDVMYWNINKLVSMLYPQFSRGRAMQTGDNKFIQPFSQIPTASPMIRLRIGDVIRGNYSRFGVARLFGLGQDVSVFNRDRDIPTTGGASSSSSTSGASSTSSSTPTDEEISLADGAMYFYEQQCTGEGAEGYAVNDEVVVSAGRYDYVTRNGVAASSAESGLSESQRRQFRSKNYTRYLKAKILEVIPASPSAPVSRGGAPASPRRRRRRTPTGPNVSYRVEIDRSAFENPSEPPSSVRYHTIRHTSVLALDPVYKERLWQRFVSDARNATTPTAGPTAAPRPARSTSALPSENSKLMDFLNPANNPVIRSFETTQGRGLAGFITDLKMDWSESTWEIAPGMRAPKHMKLSVSFSPIHDIPMGLDTDGMMRSVAYNVGSISRIVGADQYYNQSDLKTANQNTNEASTAPVTSESTDSSSR